MATPAQLYLLKATYIHLSQKLDPLKVNPLMHWLRKLPFEFEKATTIRLQVPDEFDAFVEAWLTPFATREGRASDTTDASKPTAAAEPVAPVPEPEKPEPA